jgi:hypothetical protein
MPTPRQRGRLVAALLVLLVFAAAAGGSQARRASMLRSLSFPVRGAFYYPWFPETWGKNGSHTHYHPSLGFYSSGDLATIDQHIADLDYAGVQLGIASWWGIGQHDEQHRIPELLSETNRLGSRLRWTLYYEPEGQGNPSAAKIDADLTYIENRYAYHPAFARVDGKPVIFVYSDGTDGCGMVHRWKMASVSAHFYVVLKVFPGFQTCGSQPDSWHQYGPATAEASVAGYSFSISPGFFMWNETVHRLTRSPTRWQRAVQDMVASNAPWQLITTFNEFGEGTAVEPSAEWASASGYGTYLDALHAVPTGGAAFARRR